MASVPKILANVQHGVNGDSWLAPYVPATGKAATAALLVHCPDATATTGVEFQVALVKVGQSAGDAGTVIYDTVVAYKQTIEFTGLYIGPGQFIAIKKLTASNAYVMNSVITGIEHDVPR